MFIPDLRYCRGTDGDAGNIRKVNYEKNSFNSKHNFIIHIPDLSDNKWIHLAEINSSKFWLGSQRAGKLDYSVSGYNRIFGTGNGISDPVGIIQTAGKERQSGHQ